MKLLSLGVAATLAAAALYEPLRVLVTESARAHSYFSSKQEQETCQFWLLTFWLLTFGC